MRPPAVVDGPTLGDAAWCPSRCRRPVAPGPADPWPWCPRSLAHHYAGTAQTATSPQTGLGPSGPRPQRKDNAHEHNADSKGGASRPHDGTRSARRTQDLGGQGRSGPGQRSARRPATQSAAHDAAGTECSAWTFGRAGRLSTSTTQCSMVPGNGLPGTLLFAQKCVLRFGSEKCH